MTDCQKRNSRDVDPICMISVADCGSELLQVNNASQDATVLELDAKQTWLLARLLYIMQEFQNGADANKEFRYLLRDLAQNAWPTMSCDHVMGVDYQDMARGSLANVYGPEKSLRPEDIGLLKSVSYLPLFHEVARHGFAKTNGEARRLVRGGGIWVNGKRANDENMPVKVGDVVGMCLGTPNRREFTVCAPDQDEIREG
ncbi:RNA-binding S4 domain-containing protein [Acetobacter oryzoeni]|uniref:RNA-binding S4 domain-containing protein n=1 Tax=Acetobacter oryzoeni TaxID=2500548 RepID=UPI003DA98CB1